MKYFPFIDLFSWIMGNVYTILLWIVTIDVFSVSIIFSFLLGLISLMVTVVQFILTKRLFYLFRGFIIMNNLKKKQPKQQPTPEQNNKKKPEKPKFKNIDNNR